MSVFRQIDTVLRPSGMYVNFSCRRYVIFKMREVWKVSTTDMGAASNVLGGYRPVQKEAGRAQQRRAFAFVASKKQKHQLGSAKKRLKKCEDAVDGK